MKVAKFGGSSLASAEQVEKVVAIIESDPKRRFVVVSAPGKRSSDDQKVTDLLLAVCTRLCAQEEITDLIEEIYARYTAIAAPFGIEQVHLDRIWQSLAAFQTLPTQDNPHLYDTVLASGEDNNAKLIAGILQSRGLAARYMNPQELGLLVTDEPQNARILNKSYAKIAQWRDSPEILVIPGFFGYTEAGEICTFSRGGSGIWCHRGGWSASRIVRKLYRCRWDFFCSSRLRSSSRVHQRSDLPRNAGAVLCRLYCFAR